MMKRMIGERATRSWASVGLPLIAAGLVALALAILWPDRALGGVGVIGGAAALAVGDRAIKAIGLAVAAVGIMGLVIGLL